MPQGGKVQVCDATGDAMKYFGWLQNKKTQAI